MATFLQEAHRATVRIPAGSVVIVDSEMVNENQPIEVTWAGKLVVMFAQDIRARGMKVE